MVLHVSQGFVLENTVLAVDHSHRTKRTGKGYLASGSNDESGNILSAHRIRMEQSVGRFVPID